MKGLSIEEVWTSMFDLAVKKSYESWSRTQNLGNSAHYSGRFLSIVVVGSYRVSRLLEKKVLEARSVIASDGDNLSSAVRVFSRTTRPGREYTTTFGIMIAGSV